MVCQDYAGFNILNVIDFHDKDKETLPFREI